MVVTVAQMWQNVFVWAVGLF